MLGSMKVRLFLLRLSSWMLDWFVGFRRRGSSQDMKLSSRFSVFVAIGWTGTDSRSPLEQLTIWFLSLHLHLDEQRSGVAPKDADNSRIPNKVRIPAQEFAMFAPKNIQTILIRRNISSSLESRFRSRSVHSSSSVHPRRTTNACPD